MFSLFVFGCSWMSALFGLALFAPIYDKKAKDYDTAPFCNHQDCVSTQLYVCIGACAISLVAGVILAARMHARLSRTVYG